MGETKVKWERFRTEPTSFTKKFMGMYKPLAETRTTIFWQEKWKWTKNLYTDVWRYVVTFQRFCTLFTVAHLQNPRFNFLLGCMPWTISFSNGKNAKAPEDLSNSDFWAWLSSSKALHTRVHQGSRFSCLWIFPWGPILDEIDNLE